MTLASAVGMKCIRLLLVGFKMTFSIEYAAYKAINEATDKASKALLSIKENYGTAQLGRVPDSVRSTPGWQAALRTYNEAFATQRKFNAVFVKKYAKELKEIRFQNRKGKIHD